MRPFFYLILTCLLHVKCLAEDASAPPFLVFDATAYRGKPSGDTTGLRRIHILYERSFWTGAEGGRADLSANRVRTAVRGPGGKGNLVCLDIERWDVASDDPDVSIAEFARYEQVARVAHHSQPGLRLGFYSVLPIRNYWAPQHGRESWEYRTWQEQNRRGIPLGKLVDVVYPSLYTFYEDREGWVRYAEANLEEARIYGRPIYAFLWPEYHGSDKRGQEIPGEFWRLQLETCAKFADGVVIWGGWDLVENKARTLDPQAAWWIETLAFIDRQLAKNPTLPDNALAR